ncbi:unnamed protein product [Prorocentrum cordatum]|uniref:Uncharacterized protein n=1 Tax=Prorocentrum cordatum TaxID=2364126 RepID=A0ABN9XPP9_9DINO|nr:unnamed protein product [Polarella glacialis]
MEPPAADPLSPDAAGGRQGSPTVADALAALSLDRDLRAAQSAPELLGLSLMRSLRVSAAQARELLESDARRLARAFVATGEQNSVHLVRWLEGLTHFGGALAELVLLHPGHARFTVTAVGTGMRSPSPAVAEWRGLPKGVCGGLVGTPLRSVASSWLVESPALKDLAAVLAARPSAQAPVTAIISALRAELAAAAADAAPEAGVQR